MPGARSEKLAAQRGFESFLQPFGVASTYRMHRVYQTCVDYEYAEVRAEMLPSVGEAQLAAKM